MDLRRAILLLLTCSAAWAAPPRDGATVYKQSCAECHDAGVNRAPARIILKLMPPERILSSMESGSMKVQATDLTPEERRAVAEYLTERPLGQATEPSKPASAAYCAGAPRGLASPGESPHWNGWGAHPTNRRFQSAKMAGLRPE